MKLKRKGKVTFFTAKKDGQFVVMDGIKTIYRGKDLDAATKKFDDKVKEKKNNA